jgi:hypothetical protein
LLRATLLLGWTHNAAPLWGAADPAAARLTARATTDAGRDAIGGRQAQPSDAARALIADLLAGGLAGSLVEQLIAECGALVRGGSTIPGADGRHHGPRKATGEASKYLPA